MIEKRKESKREPRRFGAAWRAQPACVDRLWREHHNECWRDLGEEGDGTAGERRAEGREEGGGKGRRLTKEREEDGREAEDHGR